MELNTLKDGATQLGLHLTATQIDLFARYLTLLQEGNRRANLTAILEPEEIMVRHFLDSLTLSAAIDPNRISGSSLLDVGSGAGFPGLPIAIAFPSCRVTLLESKSKKTAFLQSTKSELGLSTVTIVEGRSETMAHDPSMREAFDIVVARAVSKMATLAELMLPFARVGGTCIAYKGRRLSEELSDASYAMEVSGNAKALVLKIDEKVTGNSRQAHLVVLAKGGPTPKKYPRRAGVPHRRPLQNFN